MTNTTGLDDHQRLQTKPKYSPCFKETTPTTGSNDDDEASVYFFAALVNSTLCLSRS